MTDLIANLLSDAEQALQAGDTTRGAELCGQILAEDSQNSSALFLLGTLNYQRGDHASALQQLGRAAELEPEAVDIACNLAGLFMHLGDRKQAIMVLQRATKYCKDDAVFCPRIADMFVQLGEPGAAIQLLSRLHVLPPADQLVLARAHGRLANWREAVNILRQLHEAVPDDSDVAEQLAVNAMQVRDYPLAIKAYERFLRQTNPTANHYLRFADLLLIAQDPERSLKAAAQAANAGEDGAEIHVLKARIARLQGDYEGATAAASEAIKRAPVNGQAWSVRAEMGADNQISGFIDELDALLSNNADAHQSTFHRAQLRYALAQLHDREVNVQQAVSAWKQANEIQYSELQASDSVYSANYQAQMVDYIIDEFPLSLFDQADAEINSESMDIQPIFIVGAPRSGTTLVERILGQHSQVTNGGEQEAMEYLATDFRQQISSGKLPHPSQITADQWSALRIGYLQRLPEISTPIFTDKMPHNFRHVGLILKLFPEARVIQMHRSAPDLALSIFTHPFAAGHNYANRIDDIAHFSEQAERLMAHWSSIHSTRVLDLNYEQLVSQPEHFAKQVVEFCGLSWDPSFLDFHESNAASFTFSELQVREPIDDKRVDRWRTYAEYLPALAELA